MSTREAFGKALARIGSYEDLVVLDADVSESTKTAEFKKKYPERFINFGIAEENLFATAIGLAYSGLKVYASLYSVFVLKAYDQLRIIAHDNLDVKIFASHSGLTNASDGWSHQTVEDVAVFRALPNFKVVVPADAVETDSVTEQSLNIKGPMYVRLSRTESPIVFKEGFRFELGKGNVMLEGSDAYIIANGNMLVRALSAAEALKREGIRAGVINMSSVKPLDEGLVLKAAKSAGALVVAEEHSVIGGLGGAVAELVSKHYPVPVEFVGINDSFGQSGKLEELYELFGLTPENIANSVKKVIGRKK